ncbi:tyrosine-protein kinase family protein [Spirosoma sp. KNUC1025]|uniref:GumC family protein n=1 Tax=Spirosoma sp. KNUC1025 TaxID=2894082 RepID=UPI0038690160|nr:polysaccharide biosynthesis tyrosine autokinase [Spirosoma sp. KNUC1025]
MDDLFSSDIQQAAPKKDIGQLVAVFLKRWKLFLGSVILALVLAFVYIKYISTPVYKISSSILIKEDVAVPNLTTIATFNGLVQPPAMSNLINVITLLQSRALMTRVVTELGLTTSYFVQDGIKNWEIYGRDVPIKVIVSKLDSTMSDQDFTLEVKSGNTFLLTDFNGDAATYKFGEQINKPYGTFTVVTTPAFTKNYSQLPITFNLRTLPEVVDSYSKALTILPVSDKASVLVVAITSPVPLKGVEIISKLLELYGKDSFEIKKRSVNNTIAFLDDRLKYITGLLSGVEQKVEEYKRRNELTDVSSQATEYITQANANATSISEWAIQIDILESLENYLNQTPGQYQLVPSTLGIQDPTLMNLITKFNELALEKERMLRTIKANSPLVKNINDQLANLRLNILENLRNIKNSLTIKSDNYKANADRFRSKISKVPSMERDLLEISRQQAIKQNIYAYLLQKREESTIAKAALVPDSEIIDPARADGLPVSPNILVVLIIAVLAGLFVPAGYIYRKEFLSDKVRSKDDILAGTPIPVLAEISRSYEGPVVFDTDNAAPLIEQFRHIRAKLLFAEDNNPGKIYMITSAQSGEGKTFFSTNLALSLHQAGKKVILLELDLRNPSFSDVLSLSNSVGLTDYLTSDKITLGDILQFSDKTPNMPILTAGSSVNNSAELLMSPKFGYLIEELKSSFDFIVIDTSPIGQVADIFSLNPLVDKTIFLMRYNYSQKQDVAVVDELYKSKMTINPVIVFNDIQTEEDKKKGKKKSKARSKKKNAYS